MSPGGNLVFVIQSALFLVGLGLAAMTLFLPVVTFNSAEPGSQRFGSAVTFLSAIILGVPMAMSFSNNLHMDFGEALFDADTYRAYVISFSSCIVIAGLSTSAVSELTGWWKDEPFVENLTVIRVLEFLAVVAGVAALGFYFGKGLDWAVIGLLVGVVLGIIGESHYRRDYQKFLNTPRPHPAIHQATAIEGEIVDDVTPSRPAAAEPAYSRPSQDVASGFDVPPQR